VLDNEGRGSEKGIHGTGIGVVETTPDGGRIARRYVVVCLVHHLYDSKLTAITCKFYSFQSHRHCNRCQTRWE
jgi:hypothetical protein